MEFIPQFGRVSLQMINDHVPCLALLDVYKNVLKALLLAFV